MNKQTSVLGAFLVLQTSSQKAPGSKERKAMKNCSGRTKKSQYHLQKGSVLSCAPLHSHKRGRLQGWTREQPSGRAGKQDFGRKGGRGKRGIAKKAQLKYHIPATTSMAREPPPWLLHSCPLRWASLQAAFGFSTVTRVCYYNGLTYSLGH